MALVSSDVQGVTCSRPDSRRRVRSANRRKALVATDIVDNLQHAFPIRSILHAELRYQAGIVDQVSR